MKTRAEGHGRQNLSDREVPVAVILKQILMWLSLFIQVHNRPLKLGVLAVEYHITLLFYALLLAHI